MPKPSGELEAFFHKRLALPDGATLVLALFTVNTYLFDVFDTTPYIQIDSAVGGCGKSTLLLHLEATCRRATRALGFSSVGRG